MYLNVKQPAIVCVNCSTIKNACHLQTRATCRGFSFTHTGSVQAAESSFPRTQTPDVSVEVQIRGDDPPQKQHEVSHSNVALFQTLIYTLSHTLTLTYELSWKRIKEKVHTHGNARFFSSLLLQALHLKKLLYPQV